MSDLNLSASNDGSGILRINVPALTEERRKDLVKQAKSVCEDGKVAIRNHRRDGVRDLRGLICLCLCLE
jgi:ribosome recycling factor